MNFPRPAVFLCLLLAAACAPLAATARAQLGETPKEIARRYGPVARHNARVREHAVLDGGPIDGDLYEKGGFYIRVVYDRTKGAADLLEFSRKEGPLTPADAARLLNENAGGSKWEPGKDSTDAIKFYRRADGAAIASWTTGFHGSLLIAAEKSADLLQRLLSS